jgi:hypothetical protein
MPEEVGPTELPADVAGDVKSSSGSLVDRAKAILTRKIGPVPVWMIVVAGGGGLAYLLLKGGGLSNALSGSRLSAGSGNAGGAGGGASSIVPDILIPSHAAQNGGSASPPQTAPVASVDTSSAPQVPVSGYSPFFTDLGAGSPLIGQQASATDGGLSTPAALAGMQSEIPTLGSALDTAAQQSFRASERASEGAGIPLGPQPNTPAQQANYDRAYKQAADTPPPPPPPVPTAPAQQTYRAGERSTEGAGVPYTPPAAPAAPDTSYNRPAKGPQ